jgi:hypothetical protein
LLNSTPYCELDHELKVVKVSRNLQSEKGQAIRRQEEIYILAVIYIGTSSWLQESETKDMLWIFHKATTAIIPMESFPRR